MGPNPVAVQSKACLGLLKHWDRGFHSSSRHA